MDEVSIYIAYRVGKIVGQLEKEKTLTFTMSYNRFSILRLIEWAESVFHKDVSENKITTVQLCDNIKEHLLERESWQQEFSKYCDEFFADTKN